MIGRRDAAQGAQNYFLRSGASACVRSMEDRSLLDVARR